MMRMLVCALTTAALLDAQFALADDSVGSPPLRAQRAEPPQRTGASAEPPSALMVRIFSITGPTPVDCGRFLVTPPSTPPTTDDLQKAIDCGKTAVSLGRAFWFVVGGHGVESWTGEGVLASTDGRMKHFTYDSWLRPFKAVPCDAPRANIGLVVGSYITCELTPK